MSHESKSWPARGQIVKRRIENMNNLKPSEQRQHQRFKARDGAFVAPRSDEIKYWQIIDICRDGLAFRYVSTTEVMNSFTEVDLLTRDTLFRLEKIRVQCVSDTEISNEPPLRGLKIRRLGVQFENLTDDQKSELKVFIRKYTECRGNFHDLASV